MPSPALISFKQAFDHAQGRVRLLGAEKTGLLSAAARVTAENIYAREDMPPFDRALRDGYACRHADLRTPLKIVGAIPAGHAKTISIKQGECVKIMTGARLPEGADCVVEAESAMLDDRGRVVCRAGVSSRFIAYQGQDVKAGDILVPQGTLLNSACIALLAANGIGQVCVYKPPRMGIIATGSELIEPGVKKKNHAQVFNASSCGLIARLKKINITPVYYGITADDKAKLAEVVKKAKRESDILLILGGVSMGDYDFVPAAIRGAGFKTVFHKVNIEPGKPLLFAESKDCLCFGMPGNPVSTLVAFELFVKDLILAMQGIKAKDARVKLVLGKTVTRNDGKRQGFFPALVKNGSCYALDYHGSGHLAALAKANHLLEFPVRAVRLKKGMKVNARPI